MAETRKQQYLKLLSALKTQRSSFDHDWRELANFMLPRRIRLSPTDTNKGGRRNQNIIDSTATQAANTIRAGLMSGMTSPARPWFRLGTEDADLAKYGPVKNWLEQTRVIMANGLRKSNFYQSAPMLYGDTAVFGTGAMGMFEDDTDVFRFTPFPLGEYWIANDHKLRVRTFVREFRMTVRQLVQQFGVMGRNGQPDWSNFSAHVKTAWDRSAYESPVDVCHVIQENPNADARYLASKFKPYTDCYFEIGSASEMGDDVFLREKGFDEFPILAARWEVAAGDVYGTSCPGMQAMGDTKSLQFGEKVSESALDKMVRPPMLAPTSFFAKKISQLAGEVSYGDETSEAKIRPIIDTSQFRVDYLEQKLQAKRERIDAAFYVDLFRLISSMDPKDVTATAIAEMKEEKLLLLGPVLGQFDQDVLKPGIDREFAMLYRAKKIPDAPPELHGAVLNVEYTSIMAEAEKALSRAGLDVFSGFALKYAEIDPQVLDKMDRDALLEEYGDVNAVPPRIILEQGKVDAIRAQRAQQQQQQASAEAAAQGSVAAKNLSQSKLTDNNALTALLQAGNANPGVPTGAGTSPGGL